MNIVKLKALALMIMSLNACHIDGKPHGVVEGPVTRSLGNVDFQFAYVAGIGHYGASQVHLGNLYLWDTNEDVNTVTLISSLDFGQPFSPENNLVTQTTEVSYTFGASLNILKKVGEIGGNLSKTFNLTINGLMTESVGRDVSSFRKLLIDYVASRVIAEGPNSSVDVDLHTKNDDENRYLLILIRSRGNVQSSAIETSSGNEGNENTLSVSDRFTLNISNLNKSTCGGRVFTAAATPDEGNTVPCFFDVAVFDPTYGPASEGRTNPYFKRISVIDRAKIASAFHNPNSQL